MSRFNPFDTPLTGEALSDKVQELAEVVDQLSEFIEYMPAVIKGIKQQQAPSVSVFPAAITGFRSTADGSNQWDYAWTEILTGTVYPSQTVPGHYADSTHRNSYSVTSDKFTLPAANGLEMGNVGGVSAFEGVGVRVGEILDSKGDLIGTSTFLPIGYVPDVSDSVALGDCGRVQAVLMMELPSPINGYRYWFNASNAIKVECAE